MVASSFWSRRQTKSRAKSYRILQSCLAFFFLAAFFSFFLRFCKTHLDRSSLSGSPPVKKLDIDFVERTETGVECQLLGSFLSFLGLKYITA